MARVCLLIMDSFGVGESLDAKQYNDLGADTFGSIFQSCEKDHQQGKRKTPLSLPNLARLGLNHLHTASTAKVTLPLKNLAEPKAKFGYAVEKSFGKDTPSGHFELAGVPVLFDWGYFREEENKECFPKELIDTFVTKAKLPGVLGLKAASGTEILKELGKEHIETQKPIVYTSADSVFQIAAHQEHFGLERLYEISEIARELVNDYNIGRVIARPFMGDEPNAFLRTHHRRDYSMPPPAETLLDKLKAVGREVISIGKIYDIFAGFGLTKSVKGRDNQDLFDKTILEMKSAPEGSLIFTNFVDFDSKFGHRRDVEGYAKALEDFDLRLTELEAVLRDDDVVIISADHGCDPTFPGSDHTREHVPIIAFGPKIKPEFIGRRDSFADVGQSIAKILGIASIENGVNFL